MQSYRVTYSTPRVIKRIPSNSRNMAFCTPFGYRVARRSVPVPAPFFPSVQADFTPFIRLFNEIDSLTSAAAHQQQLNGRQSARSFQPRFDVREEKDAYHLQGELPGVDQKDLNIEFVDQSTLVVRGKTVRERTAGTPPTASGALQAPEEPKAIEQQQQQDNTADAVAAEVSRPASPASSVSSNSNYQQPTVEEEHEDGWTEAVPTPATTATELAKPTETTEAAPAQTEQAAEPEKKEQQQQQNGRYWVSERSVGTFQRTFSFQGQIDQDAVTASLKNGVLHIVVPKQQPKQPRKITVE